ncbi:PepSY domain-containing protein [Magnetospirillum fulvum]|uniref:Peptidase propeptide and YPEB domain-containing protein n=1 Tax=Magnetospirillum fulvum TaxID=1082 RepID=A0A1H6IXQ4_MAGFU|nr:PepSY domain-containing protein [Magnetospirillum fulvum]SEH54438.1 Peptidase propeptide and YPEB domain-containing protein [Magnetospirillum fulvum]
MKAMLALLLTFLFLSAIPARADDYGRGHGHDDEHEWVRRSVLAGEIMPLTKILDRVERDFGGELIETELDEMHGRPVYEIKLIGRDGRMRKLIYDAADGTLLKNKERR